VSERYVQGHVVGVDRDDRVIVVVPYLDKAPDPKLNEDSIPAVLERRRAGR
jgi:hypothetical protein